MKKELEHVKYTYIKSDITNAIKRCNHKTRHYERYDFSQDEWVVDNDFNAFEDFFDFRDITEEEALKIISDRKSKFKT